MLFFFIVLIILFVKLWFLCINFIVLKVIDGLSLVYIRYIMILLW